MPHGPFSIAQVTPYAWESGHEVNRQVQRLSEELAARGHAVVIVAPSTDGAFVREGRAAIRAGITPAPGEVRVLGVGEALTGAGTTATAQRRAALPVDVSRTVETLLTETAFDLCHVHEPFAPSVASVALRHSHALNVGTFHAPAERVMATQVARKLVDLVFGRLDGRLTSWQATADLMGRHFPATYDVVAPAASVAEDVLQRDAAGVPTVVFLDREERGALRTFLRALRRVDTSTPWKAIVVSSTGPSSSTPLRAELRDRVEFRSDGEEAALSTASVVVCASDGALPAPVVARRALAHGAVPLCSSLPVYEEATGDGEHGLLFDPRDTDTLAAQLQRLLTDDALRTRLRDAAGPVRATLGFERLTDEVEAVYERVTARRHDPAGDVAVRRRLEDREHIDIDLHMHTDHSSDCATPVEVLLATAKEVGLGCIAITDHNEVSGAFEAREKCDRFGIEVIVAEEVKTASQGEVIGLFLEEKIPRGMSLRETVDAIKDQGGVVYVPHPFDRMHSVPDYEHLLTIVEDIDAIEVYNPRVAIGSFNEEAQRFAAKYRIAAGAGSDAHVAPGLGSVRVRLPRFEGPAEFKEALRLAEIHTKPSSLLYVQALKFLETKATPPAARKARRERRVRRATRKA